MPKITLFHSPRACSSVTMNALEEIGLTYDVQLIDITKGVQKSADYLSINPKGKVPALRIGHSLLTENAAILYHLNRHHPVLLPDQMDQLGSNQGLEDLVWCSSGLHPMTRQVRMPSRLTSVNPEAVRENGLGAYKPILGLLSERFADGHWWYGDQWSILDVYLYWNYTTAERGGMDLAAFPAIADHAERVRARPSFVQALANERALEAA